MCILLSNNLLTDVGSVTNIGLRIIRVKGEPAVANIHVEDQDTGGLYPKSVRVLRDGK
jgi:hypothetical protein